MSTPFHNVVSLSGFSFDDSILTFKLSGTVVAADVGKPMSLDTAAANTAKIAADGKAIIGKLESVENRNGVLVGAVSLRYATKFPVKAADALAVGDKVVGAGNGEVRKWVTNDQDNGAFAVEVTGGIATVLKV